MAVDPRDPAIRLDPKLLLVLPEGSEVLSVTPSGTSEWGSTYRIAVRNSDNTTLLFFQNEFEGQYGHDILQACFETESIMYKYIPDFAPRPIAFGTYEANPQKHFFLAAFVELDDEVVPSPDAYMAAVVALHRCSMADPVKNFGFDVSTRFGDLAQNNAWEDSWEKFWTRTMREILDREEAACGQHDEELAGLKLQFLEKVLPRYLRPLESNGRSITPCLVHADLWPGNCKYRLGEERVSIYDACAFWGHNEADLGVFSNPRYPLGMPYLTEYWNRIPPSEPQEDALSRNTMYMIRNQILLATLYPSQKDLRPVFVETMRQLVERVLNEGVA